MIRVRGLELQYDLLLINLVSALLLLCVVFLPDSPLRLAFGVPFVLFFPGYTLICALFPKKRDLDGLERVALSIGLSLAVVPLLGLGLNYTPFGIRLYPILVSQFLFTLLMSMATVYRMRALPVGERFSPFLAVDLPRWRELSASDRLMAVGLSACIVVAGGLSAYFVSMPRVGERFTEFYVLGPDGKVEGYPTNLTVGESGTVILGVVNHEYEEVDYSIVVKLDNETIGTLDRIKLKHDEKWEQNYTFTPEKIGEKMKLEFPLYKKGVDNPYRSLYLWITVKSQK